MLHVFRFDPAAVHVPPRGNLAGERYRLGDWQCAMCRASAGLLGWFGLDDCPGLVRSAPPDSTL